MEVPKRRNYHRIYMQFGVLILVISAMGLLFFYGRSSLLTSFSLGFTWLGILPILDFLLMKKFQTYYLPVKTNDWHKFIPLCFLSVGFCLFLDTAGMYATRLWRFPYIPFYIYFFLIPFFYVLYTLVLFELYEIFKHILKHHDKPIKISQKIYDLIMKIELFLGIVTTISWILFSIFNISRFTIPFWEIRLDSGIPVPWWFGFAAMLSVFFIFEYISYLRKRDTLTKDILKGDQRPMLAILIANIAAIILMEMVNAPFRVWVYDNWFMQNTKLLTLPVLVIILWPTQFLAFLSLFNALIEKKKPEIW